MITPKHECTGCNACMAACPIGGVISNGKDKYDTVYPQIDDGKCAKCGICNIVCPSNTEYTYIFPQKVYAAWSKNDFVKNQASSGGIASEIYLYGLKNGYFMMGTFFDREKGVYFKRINSEKDIEWACDSKYVFSDMTACFKEYENELIKGKKCIFIGLPCQVAAIKTYCNLKCRGKMDSLIVIDVICHGVPNYDYFSQHLDRIEHKKKAKVESVRFRILSTYALHLFGAERKLIYKKRMHEDDLYYRSFAVNLDFRENCYHCKYARNERISDITLGDYSGLGKLWTYEGNKNQVSMILCMTQFGEKLIDEINIHKIERPLAEPASAPGNPQLRHPSIPHKNRRIFLMEYEKNQDFEKASYKALRYLLYIYYCNLPMRGLKSLIPKKVKLFLKRWRN